MSRGFGVACLVFIIAVGCWRQAPPSPPSGSPQQADETATDTRIDPNPTPPTRREKTAPSSKAEPPAAVRKLDKDADAELTKAFGDNPIAARKKYGAIRWRFEARVAEFDETGLIVSDGGAGGSGSIHLRKASDVEKLTRYKPFAFEGKIEGYGGPGEANKMKWVDATVVGPAESP